MSKLILIVDDNEDNLAATGQIVRLLLGHQALIAGNGQEAIRVAQEHKPDLILMDLTMPVLDGWQATAILKKMDDLQDIPIIALTAHAMLGDREKALQAGCDDYLSKPLNIDAVVALIGKYLPIRPERRKVFTNGHLAS